MQKLYKNTIILKLSVIINNYNYSSYLELAIHSVIGQTRYPDEIIVVDDGSTDNSLEVIQKAIQNTDIKLHRKKNGGQLSAVRAGLNEASGDWVFFLDSDDEWEAQHLEEACKSIEQNPDVSLYFSNHQETAGLPIFRSKWPSGKFGPCSGLVAATGIRTGSIASTLGLRIDKARCAISFDPSIDRKWRMRAEDCLIFGASLSGAIVYYNPNSTVKYRIHDLNSFAHKDQSQTIVEYEKNKKELFHYWLEKYAININSLDSLISNELSIYNHNWINYVLRRRSFRAIRKFKMKKILDQLSNYFSKL